MKGIILFAIGTFFSFNMKSQSICKTWYSEEDNICISIDSVSKCVIIQDYYEMDCDRITYKLKDEKLN